MGRRWTACATLVGIALAVASSWPLVTVMRNAIPAPPNCPTEKCADYPLCVWIMGYGGRQLYRDPMHLYEGNMFHPFKHSFAYSESMLSSGAIVAPLNALTRNPILGYNLFYLACQVLWVVGMFLLVREITGVEGAALVAGVVFGLTPERDVWWGFPPALALHWAPFLMYAWLRFLRQPSWGRGLGLGTLLLAQMHASAYQGLMVPALLMPWALVLVVGGPWTVRQWLRSAIPLVLGAGVGLALYLPYDVVRDELHYQPAVGGVAWAIEYWWPLLHPLAYASKRWTGDMTRTWVSPLAEYLLAAAGVVIALRRGSGGLRGPAGERAHLVAALLVLWLAIAVSLGPDIWLPLLGPVHGPLYYLRFLPAFSSMRAVVRFMLTTGLARGVVVGIAVALIVRRVPRPVSALVCVAVVTLAVLDARLLREDRSTHPLPAPEEVEPVYRWLAKTPPATVVLELPYGLFGPDAHLMVNSLYHQRTLMNGYSAVLPRFHDVLAGFPDEISVRALQDAGVTYVLAHANTIREMPFGNAQIQKLLAHRDWVVGWFGSTLVVKLPLADHPLPASPGKELSHDGWRASASEPGGEAAIDGELQTHWLGHANKADGFLQVDFGKTEAVAGITLRLAQHALEYPRTYRVEVSLDGAQWERVGGEAPTLPPFLSYRHDHRDVALVLQVHPAEARYVRITVPRYPDWSWAYSDGTWGVHEIEIYGPAS